MNEKLLKDKLLATWLEPAAPAYSRAAVYFVYRTIEANERITLNQLRHLLLGDLLLSNQATESALSVLVSRTFFNAVNMYQIKTTGTGLPNFQLTVKPTPECLEWLAELESSYPELRLFVPPIHSKKNKAAENHEAV